MKVLIIMGEVCTWIFRCEHTLDPKQVLKKMYTFNLLSNWQVYTCHPMCIFRRFSYTCLGVFTLGLENLR